MKLKLIDAGQGHWCIHEEGINLHIADLQYGGSGLWILRVTQSDSDTQLQESFSAPTVDQAYDHAAKLIHKLACYQEPAAGAAAPVSPQIDEKIILFHSVIDQFFGSFSRSGPEGMAQFMDVMANALGATIAIGAQDIEGCTGMAIRVIREATKKHQANMAALAQIMEETPRPVQQH